MNNNVMNKTPRLRAASVQVKGRAVAATWIVLCIGLLLMAGCASTSSLGARDKQIQERAQARWDALLAGDYATAYSYASPGYRSATSAVDFEIAFRLRRVQYTSADYKEHSCEEAVCKVRMEIGHKVIRPVAGLPEWKSAGVIEERWIKTDGEWWFLPEN